MKVGDRVQVLLHSRCRGIGDTGGGWNSEWIPGTIIKVNRKTVDVRTDIYYFRHDHLKMPLERVRLL